MGFSRTPTSWLYMNSRSQDHNGRRWHLLTRARLPYPHSLRFGGLLPSEGISPRGRLFLTYPCPAGLLHSHRCIKRSSVYDEMRKTTEHFISTTNESSRVGLFSYGAGPNKGFRRLLWYLFGRNTLEGDSGLCALYSLVHFSLIMIAWLVQPESPDH